MDFFDWYLHRCLLANYILERAPLYGALRAQQIRSIMSCDKNESLAFLVKWNFHDQGLRWGKERSDKIKFYLGIRDWLLLVLVIHVLILQMLLFGLWHLLQFLASFEIQSLDVDRQKKTEDDLCFMWDDEKETKSSIRILEIPWKLFLHK